MKKMLALLVLFPAFILVAPPSAHAVVNSINGQSAPNQLLTTPGSNAQNSMHMEIIQQGNDTNRFRWDGSPWRVDQGGTGLLTSPAFGELLVGDGLGGYTLMGTSTLEVTASPAGENGQIQFNSSNILAGDPNLVWVPVNASGESELILAGVTHLRGLNSGLQIATFGGVFAGTSIGLHAEDTQELPGGNIDFNAGSVASGSQQAGDISLDAGRSAFGTAGDVVINAGESEFGEGGSILLAPGAGSPRGFVKIADPMTSAQISLDTGAVLGDTAFVFPSNSGTFAILESSQLWTGDNTFSKGASATSTITFGELGDSSSIACFNTKNTTGGDISFYFVGTTMVVENNLCQ